MKQRYHSNAVTNIHIRTQIKESALTNIELVNRFNISESTVSKWKHREVLADKSSRPANITYALTPLETALGRSLRASTWLPLDEIWELLMENNPKVSRSSVYRLFCREGINKVPKKEKEKANKFKEYEPGYLHIDVTYLPKFDGKKHYLFVAIDRATRAMYYKVYDAKTSKNAEDFMGKCLSYFPFGITHVLTDNGLEFTNRLLKSKKGDSCTKPSKLDIICDKYNIDHRCTKPFTPKTNGMVEKANDIIKNKTIKISRYDSVEQMNNDLMKFLIHYNLYRRHGSLRRELKVKTPFDAVQKWFDLDENIFKINPMEFKNKILALNPKQVVLHQQPCET